MSTLLLRSAAGALRRSIRHSPSLPPPVVENQRLFSSGFPGKKEPNKQHDGNFHILKHMKQLKEQEKILREVLAMTRESTNHVLDKHSLLLKEIELRDKKIAEQSESPKKLIIWSIASFCAFFALCKTGKS